MSHPPVFYLLLAVCLLLAAGLSVAALRRANQRRRLARLGAGWLAILGLWLTAYPPQRSLPGSSTEVILLTQGYQPDTLRRLVRQLGRGTRVWRFDATTASAAPPTITSLQAIRERYPALRRLHVLGRGLPAAALTRLDSLRLVQHTPPPFQGFTHASWNQQPELGQPVILEGVFAGRASASPAPVWLSLRGPGRLADSVRVAGRGGSFRLRYLPKTAGRAVYQLSARQGGRVLATEPVPVEVAGPRPLRILLLSAAPSFEFKFLKNHLGTQQHRVALRTGLTPGLTQTEFLNQPAHDLTRITAPLLNRYDVVVADAGTLNAISAAEAQTLRRALQSAGLGLVVLADAAALPRATPTRASFGIVPRPASSADRPQSIAWTEGPKATALVPAALRLVLPARALVADARRQPVVATQRLGLGSVTVSVVPQTYPWILQNAAGTYQSYWSTLLRAAARPWGASDQWQVLAAWPRPHEPLPLRLISGGFPPAAPTVTDASGTGRITLALEQDAALPEWKTGCYWPAMAGWHQLQVRNQSSFWFYVFAAPAWAGPENRLRQLAAQPWRTMSPPEATPAPEFTTGPWPAGWFFGLFVLAAGFLWLEEKL
ncbi:hypothetical protein GCM10022408_13020 [Hymenobacter fastidiosus]|uniref:DUF4350 domain-containing protein n=1 Tax=Hymenobacter fastidiosus TaxID=486264 RepID=A0ABP7RVZ4_9BACT